MGKVFFLLLVIVVLMPNYARGFLWSKIFPKHTSPRSFLKEAATNNNGVVGAAQRGPIKDFIFKQLSISLDPWYYASNVSQVEDDGYSEGHSWRRRLTRKVLSWTKWRKPGTLIIIRHGESSLNYNKTFTGWIDTDLNERGVREVEHAARLLLERGYEIDVTYTSRLKRAIRSSWILMRELNQIYRPVYKSWRLNERMYGALEGMSKPGLAQELGEEIVQAFRTGLTARPPPMTQEHPHWHLGEKKYADLSADEVPVTESLQDTMERTLPLWHSRILPDLQVGRTVMIVAHANSLRGIVKHIDNLTPEEIQSVAIPNGIPLVYKFDRNMKPIKQEASVSPITGEFLEKKGLLRAALAKEAELSASVPGYSSTMTTESSSQQVLDPRLRGLAKLTEARKLIDQAVGTAPIMAPPSVFPNRNAAPATSPGTHLAMPNSEASSGRYSVGSSMRQRTKDPIIVIIRHGKTEYNKLGVFTGWEDAPLANEGRIEARNAGQLLKRHGVELDVVYTSWLSRAIETAWLVLDELDCLWLPIVKSWRLNERMYGALTGLSKKMIAQRHGEAKFKEWRRSYAIRPPAVSSFSANYPGNDDRYVKYASDLRVSVSETIIRSLSDRHCKLHRKYPKTESLKDCMSRTIPFFTNTIVPQSIAVGKTVLIASSENAIRGLLMHLCDIPPDRISEVEIPTGLPLIYNMRKRCIQILETGEEDPMDPIGHLDFGSSPELLFRPCETTDAECFIATEGKSYAWYPLIRLPENEALAVAQAAAAAAAAGGVQEAANKELVGSG